MPSMPRGTHPSVFAAQQLHAGSLNLTMLCSKPIQAVWQNTVGQHSFTFLQELPGGVGQIVTRFGKVEIPKLTCNKVHREYWTPPSTKPITIKRQNQTMHSHLVLTIYFC